MSPARKRLSALVAGVALSCGSLAAAGWGTAYASPPAQAQRQVTVMTQNLYLGANLTPLFAPGDFVAKATAILAHVQQVDFPARAAKIAEEVGAHNPDLIGLQEVARWQTGADCTHLSDYSNYQQSLLDALDARGLHYRVASSDQNFSLAVPIPGQGCASFSDSDVILARSDLPVSQMQLSNPQSAEYGSYPALVSGLPNQMPVSVTISPGQTYNLSIDRGWASVDVKVRGKSFRFVDTHLEAYGPTGNPGLFRDIQANLLAQNVIDTSPLPVVAVGDYNSNAAPTPDMSGAYGILLNAGLTDSWPLVAPEGDQGYTSGQTDDLNVVPSRIDHRIDLVMFSDGPVHAVPDTGFTVGNAPATATLAQEHAVMAYSGATGQWLWPSDHAGVVATLDIAKP